MNDTVFGILVFFVIIGLVVLVNIGIVKRYTGKNRKSESFFFSKTLEAAKNPWKQENQDLDELAKLVEKVKKAETPGNNLEEINEDNKTSNL
jgi:predicted negative regulator of RcsB-dependent stress response